MNSNNILFILILNNYDIIVLNMIKLILFLFMLLLVKDENIPIYYKKTWLFLIMQFCYILLIVIVDISRYT